ncbi:hypothetical protein PanWU01x14_369710, partial [Parasponia andersonii]
MISHPSSTFKVTLDFLEDSNKFSVVGVTVVTSFFYFTVGFLAQGTHLDVFHK